jgi:TIR domain
LAPKVLFNKYDFYDVVEDKKRRLKLAYKQLPDDKAMDEALSQSLKEQHRMDVPLLRTEKMEYEERETSQRARHSVAAQLAMGDKIGKELLFHIPFEGDAGVFEISPSARNGTVATGEIVGQELLLTVEPLSFEYDVEAHIKRELGYIEWRLNNLRGSTAHIDNELEATIRTCIAARKRSVGFMSSTVSKLNIPRRESATTPAQVSRLVPKPIPATANSKTPDQCDVFISHATEDKAYVGPLAEALETAGISTWYDKTRIGWGDDIRQSIDEGLVNCKYGIIVFSKAFLGKKKWTEYEVSALFGKETAHQKRILPIWHEVSYEDVLAYSPALAQRRALSSTDDPNESIVRTMLEKLDRPVQVGAVAENMPKAPSGLKSEPFGNPIQIRHERVRLAGLPANDDLNPKEVELLWTAARSYDGEIYHSLTLDGEGIRANERHFLLGANARTASEWLSALRGLENRGFIEPSSDDRDFFKLTGEGYAAADQLEDFARWDAHSITLRAYYMNADAQEHKLVCKGIVALPATYYPDQIGAALSVQRSLKERRSLLVENLDSMPNIDWKPTDVEFMDDASGKVETFRVEGMEYIRPGRLKLPIVSE